MCPQGGGDGRHVRRPPPPPTGSAERDLWCTDTWDAVAAHIGAALRITTGAASNQLLIAVALHERFPLVAAVFADGLITYQLVRTVVQRGALVVDPDALHELDRLLAEALSSREPMSVATLEKTVDAFVAQVDPQAVIRTETRARGRSVEVGDEDGSGMATVFATLFAHDAKAFDARMDALARTVCPADPRTLDQRRADAMGALAHGADRLACLCGTEDCPAGENPPSTGVVVYVIASADTIATPEHQHRRHLPGATGPVASRRRTRMTLCREADPPTTRTSMRLPAQVEHPPDPADERTALDGEPPAMFTKPLRELTLTEALTPTPGRLASLRPAALMGGQFLPGADRLPRHGRGDHHPDRPPRPSPTRTPLPTVEEAGRLRPLPRPDVPLPGLPRARDELRCRPYDSVAVRTDGGVQPEMSMPSTPLVENVLGRREWLARRTTRRRHRHLDRTRRPQPRHHTGQPPAVPRTVRTDRHG